MEIRDQMTATVRLTKQAAQRLSSFLTNLKTQPRNMNDALNLALSDLPISSFIDEILALQQDERKSLTEICVRCRSTGLLKRTDYYFMVLMAKRAAVLSKKERVRHESIQAVLEMILALWDLCKSQDNTGGHERYMLGNLGGNGSDPTSHKLVTHIPAYIEKSKKHPFPATLGFALRNPEVMLRDNLTHIDDAIIHERLHKYFDVLHGMAIRCLFLETGQHLVSTEDQGYFEPPFSKNFGGSGMLYCTHGQDKNFSFTLAFKNFNLSANNIVEAEEFIAAFTPLDESNLSYRGENFSLLHDNGKDNFKGGFVFQTRMLQTSITRKEYDEASHAIADLLSDQNVQSALRESQARFGTI